MFLKVKTSQTDKYRNFQKISGADTCYCALL